MATNASLTRSSPNSRAGAHAARRSHVVLVVACSARKRYPAHPTLTLGSVEGKTIPGRARGWRARLDATDATAVRACDLYAGDHWNTARRAHDSLRAWS